MISSTVNYQTYLFETMLEDIKLENYINKQVLSLNESNNTIVIVNEDYKKKMKNVFATLLDNITRLWKRFIEVADGFAKKDTDYLKKYKDIIINTKLEEDTYMMYDYEKGIPHIEKSSVPKFDFNRLKDDLVSEEGFINKHFKQYQSNDASFTDRAKQIFRGSDKEVRIPSNRLKMSEIYDYCINYKLLVTEIENDMKEIERSGNDAIDKISKIRSTSESYISEVEKIEDENKKETEDNTNDIDKIKLYIKVCYKFLGAKMSVCQEIYKGYMFIIRDHVKTNVGTEKKDDKKTVTKTKNDDKKEDDKPLKKNFLSGLRGKK